MNQEFKNMEKIKLKLTEDESNKLLELLNFSRQTGNKEWDETMNDIFDKLEIALEQ